MFFPHFQTSKMAAGQVQVLPPKLSLESDIPGVSYFLFKKDFISYKENQQLNEETAVTILKNTSLPAGVLREAIADSETIQNAFELLNNQFQPLLPDEVNILKNKIINRGILSSNGTYGNVLDNMRNILKYLMIFNTVFSPFEDITWEEITQSLLYWVPRNHAVYVIPRLRWEIIKIRTEQGIPLSVAYKRCLVKAISTYTTLRLAERLESLQQPPVSPRSG